MTDADDDLLAAELVLGLLDGDSLAAASARLPRDAAFEARVDAWEARLAPLADAGAVTPPPELWARLSQRLDDAAVVPGSQTARRFDGGWETIAEGVERQIVHLDRAADVLCFFVRMRAGAVMPAHAHRRDEHCVVLEGTLCIGKAAFGAGTYHGIAAGATHPPIVASTDALFFIHGGF